MPEKSSGQVLGQLGKDFLPFGIASAPFVYGSLTAEAVEITVLGGLGAGFALTGAIVVGALAVPAAIMLAVGDNTDAAAIADAVHEVTGLISPGALTAFLAGAVVMPADPVGFAKVVGYATDLLTGSLTGGALDRLGALGSATAGFEGWQSDAISLGNSYLSSQSSSSGSASGTSGGQGGGGQTSGGGSPADGGHPSPSSPPPGGFGSGGQGGFPFDFSAPGNGDDSNQSTTYNFGPMNTSVLNLNDLNVPQAGDGAAPPSPTGAGTPPASGDTGDSDGSGSDDGSQSGGAQPSPSPGPGPSPGGGDTGGGGGDESGGGDGDGGGDD